jgi:uncharacterized protein involved in copper resistance
METMMKFLIAAVALTIAVPAAAQPAGQAQPSAHGGHDQHKGMDHGKAHKDCCDHKNKDGTPMKCCQEMAAGKKPECCEKAKGRA